GSSSPSGRGQGHSGTHPILLAAVHPARGLHSPKTSLWTEGSAAKSAEQVWDLRSAVGIEVSHFFVYRESTGVRPRRFRPPNRASSIRRQLAEGHRFRCRETMSLLERRRDSMHHQLSAVRNADCTHSGAGKPPF